MNTTKQKIIITAIELFNQEGVSNVRILDIAEAIGISPGNLTYHFKTKKALVEEIYNYMKISLQQLTIDKVGEPEQDVELTHKYMLLQVRFRFFYRDTLEIIGLVPKLKQAYKKQFESIVVYNRLAIQHAVDNERMVEENIAGHYDILAENAWAVLHAWLAKRSILGEKEVNITDGLRASLVLYIPYLTKKGMRWFAENEQAQSLILADEIVLN